MNFHCFLCGFILCSFAGMMCMQAGFLLDINCDRIINCTEWDPVCGSDHVTYDSSCHVEYENQRRYCIVGNFDRVSISHNGNCTDHENP
ncbi:Serine protease inhibitor Kazal-type 5 [Mactra antiquata]